MMRFNWSEYAGVKNAEALLALAWFEGLQLLPQHFQAMDARLEALLRRHVQMSQPHGWGIDGLNLDAHALAQGRLQLVSVSACFPDGMVVDFHSALDGPLGCSLEPNPEATRYCLALAREDLQESGVTVPRLKQVIASPLADQTNRDEKAALVRWRPNLQIRRLTPGQTLYVEIPFVEVVKTSTGFELTDYHPPSVRLIPDSAPARELGALARLLRAKAAILGVSPIPPVLTSDFQNSLGWVFAALVSGLTPLESLLAAADTHPRELHKALCSVVGSLAAVAGRLPDYFPPYDHADITASLTPLLAYAGEVVKVLGMELREWQSLPFTAREDEWSVAVPEHLQQQELLVQLVFEPAPPEALVVAWLQHALICFAHEKNQCRDLRVRGLARRLETNSLEMDLPSVTGQHLLRITPTDSHRTLERQLILTMPDKRSGLQLKRVSLMERANRMA
jgi:type VI secretion system protein ImpJ